MSESEVDVCFICSLLVLNNKSRVILDCGHCFHTSCFFHGLRGNYVQCPVCLLEKEKEEELMLIDVTELPPIDLGNNTYTESLVERRKTILEYYDLFSETKKKKGEEIEITEEKVSDYLKNKEEIEKELLENNEPVDEKWYTPFREIFDMVATGKEPKSPHLITHNDAIDLIQRGTKAEKLHNVYKIDMFNLIRKKGHNLTIGFFFENGYNLGDLVLLGTTYITFCELMEGEIIEKDKKGGYIMPWTKYKNKLPVDYLVKIWGINILDILNKFCNKSIKKFASIGFTAKELVQLSEGKPTVAYILIRRKLNGSHFKLFNFTMKEWAIELGLTRDDIKNKMNIQDEFLIKELNWELTEYNRLFPVIEKQEVIELEEKNIKKEKKSKKNKKTNRRED